MQPHGFNRPTQQWGFPLLNLLRLLALFEVQPGVLRLPFFGVNPRVPAALVFLGIGHSGSHAGEYLVAQGRRLTLKLDFSEICPLKGMSLYLLQHPLSRLSAFGHS